LRFEDIPKGSRSPASPPKSPRLGFLPNEATASMPTTGTNVRKDQFFPARARRTSRAQTGRDCHGCNRHRGYECLELGTRPTYCIGGVTVRGSNCPAPSWSRTVDSRKEEPRWGAALLFWLQIDVLHHAGVVHLTVTPALCNFLPQIRQSNIGAIAVVLLPMLRSAPRKAARVGIEVLT
jgi:hypothetical protein